MKRLPEFSTGKPSEGRKPSLSFFEMPESSVHPLEFLSPLLDDPDGDVMTGAPRE